MISKSRSCYTSAFLMLNISKKSVFLFEINELLICSLSVETAFREYLDDTVSSSLHYLVVVRSKQNNTLEVDKAVIDSSDAFEVEVVGRAVEKKHV